MNMNNYKYCTVQLQITTSATVACNGSYYGYGALTRDSLVVRQDRHFIGHPYECNIAARNTESQKTSPMGI